MKALPWISPSAVDAMLYNEPMAGSPDLAFSLMRPKAEIRKNSTADLARAKLQPSKPGDAAWGPDGLWPITCATSRLVVAPGVALEPDALETVFEGYDAMRDVRMAATGPLADRPFLSEEVRIVDVRSDPRMAKRS